MSGDAGHSFLSAEVSRFYCEGGVCVKMIISDLMNGLLICVVYKQQTFHTPSLGDEVFEIPPISLDPDQALSISDAHFELSDGTGVSTGSKSLVSNLVAEANDPSFASTFINSGSHGLEHINLGAVHQAGGTALLSSSALVGASCVSLCNR